MLNFLKNTGKALVQGAKDTGGAVVKGVQSLGNFLRPQPQPQVRGASTSASVNKSGVPGLSSSSPISNVKFGQAQPLNVQQAVRSGGLTPVSDPNRMFPQGEVLGAQDDGGGGGGGEQAYVPTP